MTCDEKEKELLKVFSLITMLSNKNGHKIMKIRHKELKKDLVMHTLPKHNPIYTSLLSVKYEGLPEVFDCFICTDGMVVLEEYIDGLTVCDIAETGLYSKSDAIKLIKSVCSSLSILHELDIIHRDIKPENIMVEKGGRVLLIDFNAARKLSAKSKDTVILGTVGYAPPEQMGLAKTDTRTDIYALGVLLNVILTGIHPNERIVKGHLGRVVRKCTAINPDERYQSVTALARAL